MILPTVYWPEETLPGGEVGALEECVLQYTLHSSEGLYHVCPVVVQVPQLAIVTLVGPPERVLFQNLQTKDIHDSYKKLLKHLENS